MNKDKTMHENNDNAVTITMNDQVARIRALLDQVATILTSDELVDEPGGWTRAEVLPDIDFLHDLAGAADPRRLVAEAAPAMGSPVTITLDDPELAATCERIAEAIPNAVTSGAGLPPRVLLRTYARLLEEGESVTLMTSHEPIKDPEA